ncbi:unnamed protein product [Lactuca virosa]|uniref:Uncharacterized protein n=1 Tax=Lactuca virosa TaxID=75947 RepID=A0AAU9NTE9_9ASTR|nr:unnamed protein product [Lactuca virosa]
MTSFTFSTWQEHPHPTTEKGFGFLQFFCLRYLQIGCCENLESFPHEHLQSLTSLEELFMKDCPSLDYSFPCGLWPPNLSTLSIGRLNKPMSEWGHQNFPTSLVKLNLSGQNSGVVSFAVAQYMRNAVAPSSFLLPPYLVSLELEGFMDVESLSEVLQQLPCLKWGHQNFPTSLVKLNLSGQNSGVVSFAVAQYMRNAVAPSSFLLPPSLVSLELEGFMDVESLSEVLQQLPCLKHLVTSSCPKLKDLPRQLPPHKDVIVREVF